MSSYLEMIQDTNVAGIKHLVPPAVLLEDLPLDEETARQIVQGREAVRAVLRGGDNRLIAVVGPCSIHDPVAALEYAQRLRLVQSRLQGEIVVVMRVYFEKPRTTVGWKGLINDPGLDGSFRINDGLRTARQLLLDINRLGVVAGGEFLDVISPQYLGDLFVWGAIGARTTESQVHRELASGLSVPVGFKNGTDGNTDVAVQAVFCARTGHNFLSVTQEGNTAIVLTKGNPDSHVILRGGAKSTNYDATSIGRVVTALKVAAIPGRVIVDCSHGNSLKNYKLQRKAAESIGDQLRAGSKHIAGIMLESHLKEAAQQLGTGQEMQYGVSITDGCIGWEETEEILETLAAAVKQGRQKA
ncbi:MAG: 3-deoxy-7-phosphoheptulonate synthase [Patescibacteria group bacterium]